MLGLSNFDRLHIHFRDTIRLLRFADRLKIDLNLRSKKEDENYERPVLGLVNHNFIINATPLYEITNKLQLRGFEVMKGIGLICSKNSNNMGPSIEINVFDPTRNTISDLKDLLSLSRSIYILEILSELDNLDRPLNPNFLENRTGKDLWQLDETNIAEELYLEYQELDCPTIEAAIGRYLQPVLNQLEYPRASIDEILEITKNESNVVLTAPTTDKNMNVHMFSKLLERFENFMFGDTTPTKIVEMANRSDVDLLFANPIHV